MVGRWIDIVILIILALGLLKGFKRGLVRELFSLVGAILAVIIAYRSYQDLSFYLMDVYPLAEWQAQMIAFVVLILGISLLAAFFGYLWSRAIRLTPFALVDHVAGAAFGAAKVGIVILAVLVIITAAGLSTIDMILEESSVVQQMRVLLPFVYEYLEANWPANWSRPAWLFSRENPACRRGFLVGSEEGISW